MSKFASRFGEWFFVLAVGVGVVFTMHRYYAKDMASQQAAWQSYVAMAKSRGSVIETKVGEELQIPGHPGYVYRGVPSDSRAIYLDFHSGYVAQTSEERDYKRFYSENCQPLNLPKWNEAMALPYGDARGNEFSAGYKCFLDDSLFVISATSSALRYVIDPVAVKAVDDRMALSHFEDYKVGTVIGIGGTLPVLLKSKIVLHSEFGQGMSADVNGDTVRIGDPTLVLRVKASDGFYTIQVLGEDGKDCRQSIANLASVIAPGSRVKFPIHLHIYADPDLTEIFSSNKMGRLDAEVIDVLND